MNWNHSVLYYQNAITDKFDSLMSEVNNEIEYLNSLDELDANENARYMLLKKIAALYGECQAEHMWDI